MITDDILAAVGVLLTAGTGFTLLYLSKHPMKWWIRRQQRRARAARLAAQKEAFERLQLAMGDLSAAFANIGASYAETFTQVVRELTKATKR